ERERLSSQGYHFTSHTDTEVVLALYLERGMAFVERLRGMYAIAILDWRSSGTSGAPTLILSRDPLGIKPLYVSRRHGASDPVVFGSELRAMLASGLIERRIDDAALCDFLAYGFVLQPRSMIEGIRMVAPGTLEQYSPGELATTTQFYSLPPSEPREET